MESREDPLKKQRVLKECPGRWGEKEDAAENTKMKGRKPSKKRARRTTFSAVVARTASRSTDLASDASPSRGNERREWTLRRRERREG